MPQGAAFFVSAFGDHADISQGFVDCGVGAPGAGGRDAGFDRIKSFAQGGFFVAFGVVPGPALQPHGQGVIADEMGALAALQQAAVGFVGAQIAHLLCGHQACTGERVFGRGAQISNGADRIIGHRRVITGSFARAKSDQMLAQSTNLNGAGRGELGGDFFGAFMVLVIVFAFPFCETSCLVV